LNGGFGYGGDASQERLLGRSHLSGILRLKPLLGSKFSSYVKSS